MIELLLDYTAEQLHYDLNKNKIRRPISKKELEEVERIEQWH